MSRHSDRLSFAKEGEYSLRLTVDDLNIPIEERLLLLRGWSELCIDRNCLVAKRLLDFDENQFPVKFVYEQAKLKYRAFSYDTFCSVYLWFIGSLYKGESDYVKAPIHKKKDWVDLLVRNFEYYYNISQGLLQRELQNIMKESVKGVVGFENLKIETNTM